MSENSYIQIEPFTGLGELFLGMSRNEIKKLLGSPDSEVLENWPDETQTDTWKYDTSTLELTFSSEDDFRLTSITTSSKKTTLDNTRPIGLSENDLIKQFPKVILDDDFKEFGKNYSYPDYEISFWLINNIVDSLTIFPEYELDEETIIWPIRL